MTRQPSLSSRGGAAVEFLLCLPLLILLALPVFDLARLLQAHMILTNMSREGANLASRTGQNQQVLMDSLAATAPPLNMQSNGMIHITKILAHASKGVTRNVVIGQYRWAQGSYVPTKGVWTCGAAGTYWDGTGTCKGFPAPASSPEVNVMTGQLEDGDVIYLVEVFYQFPLLFSGLDLGGGIALPQFGSDLYAMTIF